MTSRSQLLPAGRLRFGDEKHVALVVGNAAHQSTATLDNPRSEGCCTTVTIESSAPRKRTLAQPCA
jgi:hypothetical protein